MKRWILTLMLLWVALGFGRPVQAAPASPSVEFRYPSLFPPAPTVGIIEPRIAVDLSQQQLIAFEGMTPVRAFAVSTGDWEHPTIVGQYSVQWKRERIDLIGSDYYYHDVPYVMMFAKPFYIHAAPWRAEFGVATSHGCVTLSTADAAWLYEWAEVGTRIEIGW
ncbi:MAG: L,D-transpeptidase [Anaerolineales bacterium]